MKQMAEASIRIHLLPPSKVGKLSIEGMDGLLTGVESTPAEQQLNQAEQQVKEVRKDGHNAGRLVESRCAQAQQHDSTAAKQHLKQTKQKADQPPKEECDFGASVQSRGTRLYSDKVFRDLAEHGRQAPEDCAKSVPELVKYLVR